MKDINITFEQLDYLKHTIGYEKSRAKRGKYTPYRNYFCSGAVCPIWEDLVNKQYATKRLLDNNVFYHVSKEGMTLLEKILEIKIIN